MNIDKLIEFKAGEKAVASEVNHNFETLRTSNNEHAQKLLKIDDKFEKSGGKLSGALLMNNPKELNITSDTIVLDNSTNYFKIKGNSTITAISGFESGLAILEFLDSRTLENSEHLKLQSNVDRICAPNDVGIYSFDSGKVREINYFSAKEIHTNSFLSQSILDCPKDSRGKADFIQKMELSPNILPIMTSFENDVLLVSASSQNDTVNYMPWKALRGGTPDVYGWLTLAGLRNGWLKIEFKNSTPKIACIAITARNAADANLYSPKDFFLEGSNDDTNWELLCDYVGVSDWVQNEKRYFALPFSGEFRYYRLTITDGSGTASYVGFGNIEFFESINDIAPMSAKIALSAEKPLIINNAKGTSLSGFINELNSISKEFSLDTFVNNAITYIGLERQDDNSFAPVLTTAQPVYSYKLQRQSNRNAIPDMISYTTSVDFKKGYNVSCSSFYSGAPGTFYPFYAFSKSVATKWMASVVGGNQWLQFDFMTYRKAARFSIVASSDGPSGCVKNGFIKGYNGEEWVVLATISNQTGWIANEARYFDALEICNCSKFKLEITDIENPATYAQVAQFEIYELAYCFLIPENKFFKYIPKTAEYEEADINFIGRIKTENNFVKEVRSYAQEAKYTSEEINLAINTTYSIFHNLGLDYKNMKVTTWLRDKLNGFILPINHTGLFYIDDCQLNIRTYATLMAYTDYNGVARTTTNNTTMIIKVERDF